MGFLSQGWFAGFTTAPTPKDERSTVSQHEDDTVQAGTADPLERIADALEALLPMLEKIANPVVFYPTPNPPPPSPPLQPYGGYRCTGCGTWVGPGQMHACTGRQWPQTSPNICRTDPDLCSSTWRGGHVMTFNLCDALEASDPSYAETYGGIS